MANTEKFKVLKAVREAKNDARKARFDPSLNASQKSVLEGLYADLDSLEDNLILGILDEHIEAINKSSIKLENVAKEIKKDIKNLESIAEKVEKVAKALKVLVEIAAKASAL